jgi:hypothetical protein
VLGIFLSVPAAKILLNISYFFIQHPDSIFRKLLKTSSLDVKMLGEPGGQLTDVDLVPVCS